MNARRAAVHVCRYSAFSAAEPPSEAVADESADAVRCMP
jgi:hypothetical protein